MPERPVGRRRAPLWEGKRTVLAIEEHVEVLEGTWHGTRTVLFEFESVEAARAWCTSAGYQAAKSLRQAAADTNAVLISGL
jgi:uncharacterized protein (DUF1330 family)